MKKIIIILLVGLLLLGLTGCGMPITSLATVNGNVLGNEDAKVQVYLYSDYECPYCKIAEDKVYDLVEYYGDDIRFEFKDFVVHPTAINAHLATNCAADENKFWEFHKLVFEDQKAHDISDLRGYAIQLGLDMDKFDNCLLNQEKMDDILFDIEEAKNLGLEGTPSFVINGEVYPGVRDLDYFKQVITPLLEENNNGD